MQNTLEKTIPEAQVSESLPVKKFWWDELDGLRALAFILVFYSHTSGLFWKQNPGKNTLYQILHHTDTAIRTWGWIGVDLFFVLSAFLITSILLGERERKGKINLKNFLARRLLRIWPLYYFYLAVTTLIFPALLSWQAKLGLPVLAAQLNMWSSHILYFALFVGNYAVIKDGELVTPLNQLWSLCIEEQFYLLWGLTMTMVRNKKIICTMLFVGLLVAGLSRYLILSGIPAPLTSHLPYYVNGLTHMDSILCGALTAFAYKKWRPFLESSRICQSILAFSGCATIISIMVWAPKIATHDRSLTFTMLGVSLGWTAFLLATLTFKPLKSFFSRPWLVHVGKLTYGLYIFHYLIIYTLALMVKQCDSTPSPLTSVLVLWGLGLPLTYLAARLSWHFIEEPFIKLKNKF
ncbi:MAG: acyltransferase [Candidatus Melainabacteria bacterium]|nr:acyltransferase [Candidatus Melainabacteria bacterium]